jgi:predicted nucleic acid-binding protein
MMEVLLDTNLLARCIQPSHPLHAIAVAATKELAARKDRLCIVPQVIYEYFVVCTRPPGEYGGLGLTNEAALAEISRLSALFDLLPDSPAILPEWLRLLDLHKIIGKRAHDTRLVAAMKTYGLSHIATFNSKDFARYAGLQILAPEDLAASWAARPVSGS